MKRKQRNIGGFVSLAAAILMMAFICYSSFTATKKLALTYNQFKDLPLTEDTDVSLGYNDGMYACVLYGENIIANQPNTKDHLDTFLNNTLKKLDERIFAAGPVYTFMVSFHLVYYLYTICNDNASYYVLYALFFTIMIFVFYIVTCVVLHTINGLSFHIPDTQGLLIIFTSLLAVIAGNCAAGLLIRKVKWKKSLSVILIPMAFIMFLFSAQLEIRFLAPSSIQSFDYVVELKPDILDDDYEGEAYYDEQKNALIVNGKEYPPEMVENPDSISGIYKATAILYEAADPYSGIFLYISQLEMGQKISLLIVAAYIIKSLIWIFIPLSKKEKPDES